MMRLRKETVLEVFLKAWEVGVLPNEISEYAFTRLPEIGCRCLENQLFELIGRNETFGLRIGFHDMSRGYPLFFVALYRRDYSRIPDQAIRKFFVKGLTNALMLAKTVINSGALSGTAVRESA